MDPPVPPDERPAASERDQELWRNLLLLIEAGEVVPIVGRELLDVETPEGHVHLYTWLAERVARRLEVAFDPKVPTRDPLNAVACAYLARRDDPRPIYMVLFEESKAMLSLGIPDALLKLAAIDRFKLFVTTTFDGNLQRAIDQVRFKGEALSDARGYSPTDTRDLPGPVDRLPRPTIFHLLGRISPTDNYVVTEEDALEFVHSLQSARPVTLFNELYRKDLLVIGCRFPAWLVRFFLRLSRQERLLFARGRTIFVVDSGAREDRTLIEFLQAFRTRTEVFECNSAIEFVDELHARWQKRAPLLEGRVDSAATQAPPPPGAIFLSYASEDRDIAEHILIELGKANLDVWFDREQLMAGDDFQDRIRSNVERSSLFVPVLSRRCLVRERRFFRLEWEFAFLKARMLPRSVRFIYPVVVDDLPYRDEALPEELQRLTWHPIKDGVTADFVEAVKKQYRENQTR